MVERKQYVKLSFDRDLANWIDPLVEHNVLGYDSLTDFLRHCAREKVEYYLKLGVHPWGHARKATSSDNPGNHHPPRTTRPVLPVMTGILFLVGGLLLAFAAVRFL